MRKIFFILSILFSQEVHQGIILYTPFNTLDSTITTYLVDYNFNEINSWEHGYRVSPASMGYLMQDSTLWYPSRVSNPSMESGGVGGKIQHIDWNNNIIWEYIIANDSLQHHHDIEPLPNGNILIIAWNRKSLEEAQSMGRQTIETPLQQMWSESIFEIQPIGLDSANIVWEWHLWDHLIQDVDPNLPNYGMISEHPELMNINLGEVGFGDGALGFGNADWIHFNAIDYNEELDQIALSSRMMNEIYIIDHSTTTEEAAGHSGGNSGKGGDFLYRWGNPQNYNRGNESNQILGIQHGINWIDQGYPGEGNLIIFNNMHYANNSAVIEISPPIELDGNYTLNEEGLYGPETWEWMFYNPNIIEGQIIQSGAFRLDNGNTFITTFNANFFEVSYNGELLFEYLYPEINAKINRAQKYAENYLINQNIGDLNNDQEVNVLDIIVLVDIIISEQSFIELGDVNFDETIDVLDIILLINQILN